MTEVEKELYKNKVASHSLQVRSKGMKTFISGIIFTLIIGTWITLAVVGVISVKTAILVPVGIVIGLLIAIWLFGLWWNS